MILTKRGGDAMPANSGRSLSPTLCGCNIVNDRGGLPAVIASSSVENLIFAAANGFGNHRIRIGIMNGILLSQSQIPRARGTVSQVPADGFSLMLSQVGSIVQRDNTGTWLRTLLDR
jgi:hypothetical protein